MSILITGWNGFIWSSARQNFWISFAKRKRYLCQNLWNLYYNCNKRGKFVFALYLQEWCSCQSSDHLSPLQRAWRLGAQCQPCQHSCGALKDCCEKTANSCPSFVHAPLSLDSNPWFLSWTVLPVCLHPALCPPGSVPDPHGLKFLVWSWTCRRATMRRPHRLTLATITSSHGHLLWSSYLSTARPEPLPVLPSRLTISPLVSAKTRQWTDLQHSNWSPGWLNSYPA